MGWNLGKYLYKAGFRAELVFEFLNIASIFISVKLE